MISVSLVLLGIWALVLQPSQGVAGEEGQSVRFHNCNSTFTIKEVRVNPCPNSDGSRCPLKKGTSPTVSVTFIPDRSVGNLTATVHGIIKTIPTEFDLPNKNGCVNSGLQCPLVAGREYTYSQSVSILSSYPNLSLLIRWSLDSPAPIGNAPTGKKPDICFIIRANVVD